MRFGHHQANPEQHQRRAGIVDGQQVESVEGDQEADGADEPRRHRPRIEEFEYQSVGADQQQNESDVGIGDHGQELSAPIRGCGHDLEARSCQGLRLAGNLDAASIDFAEKIRHVVGDHVDHIKFEGLGRRKAHRRADRFGRPVRVAPVELGQAADIRDGIIDRFAGLRVRRLAGAGIAATAFFFILGLRRPARQTRRTAQLDRRGGAEIGTGRHGGDCAGIGDVGARARRARAARRHVSSNGQRRRQDRANDLAHGGIEPARGIHAQDDEAGVDLADPAKLAHDIVGNGRTDGAVDLEHHGLRCRDKLGRERMQEENAEDERTRRASAHDEIHTAGAELHQRCMHGPLLVARRAELGAFASPATLWAAEPKLS